MHFIIAGSIMDYHVYFVQNGICTIVVDMNRVSCFLTGLALIKTYLIIFLVLLQESNDPVLIIKYDHYKVHQYHRVSSPSYSISGSPYAYN